jgi:hypothetical protein
MEPDQPQHGRPAACFIAQQDSSATFVSPRSHSRKEKFGKAFKLTSFLARAQNSEKQLLASSCLSVCLSVWNNSAPTGWIFVKFDIWVLF